MFDKNFFPTPPHVIELMLQGEIIKGKTFLEPSAGKGDIVMYLQRYDAANVIACELHPDLRSILASKCSVIAPDFLELQSHQISHIDTIVMNPPFDNADRHILHAYNIAPPGCKIIALCNSATLENDYSKTRKELKTIIDTYGSAQQLGACFDDAERSTGTNISLIKIQKAGASYNTEFEGFFMEEEPEEQANGIMPYNVVRDLVNRYVGAIKIFDEQLNTAVRLNELTSSFFAAKIGMEVTQANAPIKRAEYKKELKKSGWDFIFKRLNMQKYATKGLKEEINKFVEQQASIPFTMKNIYFMIDVVIQTHRQRMDKALLEVFDKITQHHADNQYYVKGWKTNSHYLVNEKFILDYMCPQDKWNAQERRTSIDVGHGNNFDLLEDLVKALCYMTGDNYDDLNTLGQTIHYQVRLKNKYTGKFLKNSCNVPDYFESAEKAESSKWSIPKEERDQWEPYTVQPQPIYGEWFEWAYFKCKAFKKGSMHFEFKDIDVWAKFNSNIARIKGYPLFEHKQTTAWQDRQQAKQSQKFTSTLF